MIRDQETLDQLVDMIRQFVEGVLIPHENEVAERMKFLKISLSK